MPSRSSAGITDEERELVLRMGRNIRRLRTEFSLSQDELGKLAGLSGSYISNLETGGEVDSPGILAVNAIASAFGVSIDALVLEETKTCPNCNGTGWVTVRANGKNGSH